MGQQKQAIDLGQCLARGTLTADAVLPLEPTRAAIAAPSQGIDATLKIGGNSHSLPLMRWQRQYVGSTKITAIADPIRCKYIGKSCLDLIENVF